MPIEPDTKDWTWVIERPCPECGYDASRIAVPEVPRLLRENAAAWRLRLAGGDVHARPNDYTWSPLEYGAHVRDVYRVFDERLALMLAETDPPFANWDQDAAAAAGRYAEQGPAAVADELVTAGEELADAFGRVIPEQYRRTGRRSDGSAFTVETLARYLMHDVAHHLWDVRA